MNANAFGRLSDVPGTRALPESCARHLAQELDRILREDFATPEGKLPPQRQIAKRLGISQSQYNEIRKGQGKGAGVHALIALSAYAHMSIDALLGREMPLPVQQRGEQLDAIVAKLDELKQILADAGVARPTSKAGKIMEEIRRIGAAARHDAAQDRRIQGVNAPLPRRKTGS